MPVIKWRCPEDIQSGVVTQLLVSCFGQNSSSKDFILYSCVPEELYVFLVLHHFPRTRMEMACLVKKLVLECEAQR